MKIMDIKLFELETECDKLRNRLSTHEELQSEVELLKEELESSLESHKKLQEVALAFEEENRSIQNKYTEQLKDKSKLNAVNIELEFEVETRTLSFEQLERKYSKMKDKIEMVEEMEDQMDELENEKRLNMEKINELEESLNASYEDSDIRTKELQDKLNRLATENSEINVKVVTYIEDLEDMDNKMDILEKENEILKLNIKKMKEVEMFGSHIEQIEELELEKLELINKLDKEKRRRENIENELFRTEEELENYISREEANNLNNNNNNNDNDNENNKNDTINLTYNIKDKSDKNITSDNNSNEHQNEDDDGDIENYDGDSKDDNNNNNININTSSNNKNNNTLPTISEINIEELDENAKSIVLDNQMTIQSLQGENTSLHNKVVSMEQELDVLLEENGMLAKSNMELQNSKTHAKETLETKILNLQDQLNDVIDERKQIEQEKFKRLVLSAEKEYEYTQKQKEDTRENERLQDELKAAEEYLELSNAKNSELQFEIDSKEKEHQESLGVVKEELKTELRSLQVALEQSVLCRHETEHAFEEDRNRFINQMESSVGQMKEEYESKFIEQHTTIRNLEEQITTMRTFYENKSISTASSTSTPKAGNAKDEKWKSMVDIRSIRDGSFGNRDTLLNGHIHRGSGQTSGSDMDIENGDGLSEREVRRISYKVAEGSWKRLSCGLPINEENLHQIMNSNGNGQEKVYQLLNCWRTESNVTRADLLQQLTQYIDPNRKDVIKFLKEMSGIPTKDKKSIKTKFRKLKLTVRR